jgi:hypothetical protein
MTAIRKNINEETVEVAISNDSNHFIYSIRQLFYDSQ